jgi:MoxR-like ATPase
LDEIGDMPASMQAKVLRAVQERQIVHVGGEHPIPVRFWLICATNNELKQLVEQGRFREDLYYRINLIHLRIPPLRERREDVLWRKPGALSPRVRKGLHLASTRCAPVANVGDRKPSREQPQEPLGKDAKARDSEPFECLAFVPLQPQATRATLLPVLLISPMALSHRHSPPC